MSRHKSFTVKSLLIIQLFVVLFTGSCAKKCFVSESVRPELYDIKSELPASTHKRNPTFLVYGDHRPSWRIQEGFLDKRNWSRKRLFLFPVFLPGLLFNAIFGGVTYLRHVPDLGSEMRRKVQSAGEIHFKGREFIVGKAFRGEPVAVRPTTEDGQYKVFYCGEMIKKIDLNVVDKIK